MRKLSVALAVALVIGQGLVSVIVQAAAPPQCPFSRGFNLGQWFQGKSAQGISNAITITDLENMMALGADHVRVPIDLYNMSGDGPGYPIDPILFLYLDRLVDWCEELGLYVLLDNHSLIPLDADPEKEERLVALWRQMAEHFVDRSDLVLYEILNEPDGISSWEWGRIQQKAIDAIRGIDSTHTIIVSPAELGSYDVFHELPRYADDNLIYTFHFYDPFLFTHQGTHWTYPSMETLSGVPYPYIASRMPSMPRSFAGTWLGQLWTWYPDAGTSASLADRMGIPIRFGEQRRVPIYCGEFSVWAPAASHADVVRWYTDVLMLLENEGIPWTLLDDKGPFGIYRLNSSEIFPDDLDLDVVRALGLSEPGPVNVEPDTADLVIYDDLVNGYLFHGGHGGALDIHNAGDPAVGVHCLHWTGAPKYGAVTWRFTQPRDFSLLKDRGFQLRFLIKTDSPGLRFDIRFVDTDQGDGVDRPWRMVKTIDRSLAAMDGQWHEVSFALGDMIDTGSWHNNAWHGSESAFDWTSIDRIEIVADHHDMAGQNLWLDEIEITRPNGGG